MPMNLKTAAWTWAWQCESLNPSQFQERWSSGRSSKGFQIAFRFRDLRFGMASHVWIQNDWEAVGADENAYLCMIPIDPLWLSDLCVALSRAQTSAILALHRPDSRRLFFADICCWKALHVRASVHPQGCDVCLILDRAHCHSTLPWTATWVNCPKRWGGTLEICNT